MVGDGRGRRYWSTNADDILGKVVVDIVSDVERRCVVMTSLGTGGRVPEVPAEDEGVAVVGVDGSRFGASETVARRFFCGALLFGFGFGVVFYRESAKRDDNKST